MSRVSCGLALVALTTSCAWTARPSAAQTPGPTAPTFHSMIAPFPITDSTGRSLDMAFFGGFNAPRPQLVDADGDGDLDLFVQEVSTQVAYFERDGVKDGLPRFVFRTEKYRDLDVGEWYRFADVDGDGDLDLLTEELFSYIKYYRNDGVRGAYDFVVVADTLLDADGVPIFSDRQNIPQLGDIDCNGRADLLIGQLDGTVKRYEIVANAQTPSQRGGKSGSSAVAFKFITDNFEGIEIIGEGQIGGPGDITEQGPSLHGANTMALADHDRDGDLDLFWGDFFEPGLLLIENTGTCQAFNYRGKPAKFPESNPLETSGYNAPTFGDVNGDGKLDLVVGVLGGAYNPLQTSIENLYYMERTASDGWAVQSRQLLPVIDIGSESIPTVVDFDGDGDLDLLLSNKLDPSDQSTSRIYRFENIGTKTKPALQLRGFLPLAAPGGFHAAPAFGDLDGDGKLDIILGGWKDHLSWYRNTGNGYDLVDSAIVTITRGSNTVPTLGDLDGDGDLDLLIGESSGFLNFYRNEGTPKAPKFVLVSDEYENIKYDRRSMPHLVDFDHDGDLDLLFGGEQLPDSEMDPLVLYRNTGTRTKPRFERDRSFTLPASVLPALAAPATGDFDGDGDLDLILGGAGGGAVYFEQR